MKNIKGGNIGPGALKAAANAVDGVIDKVTTMVGDGPASRAWRKVVLEQNTRDELIRHVAIQNIWSVNSANKYFSAQVRSVIYAEAGMTVTEIS